MNTMSDPKTAARLIAEMMEADRWRPTRDMSDHPILGPVMARRAARYAELRRRDFTKARMTADAEAVQEIINLVTSLPLYLVEERT
jgi:hypothetical protein